VFLSAPSEVLVDIDVKLKLCRSSRYPCNISCYGYFFTA